MWHCLSKLPTHISALRTPTIDRLARRIEEECQRQKHPLSIIDAAKSTGLDQAAWGKIREAKIATVAMFLEAEKQATHWQEWDQSHVKRTVEQIAILTIKRIIAEMDCLPEETRNQCRNVFNTETALEAAQAAYDLNVIEDCARMKPGEAGAMREAKWATYEAAKNASWAAAEAGWGAKRAEAATSSAATAAANAARAAMAEKANPDNILRAACQLWIEAAS